MTKAKSIEIPALSLQQVFVPIVGISPLIVHRFGEKQKKMLRDKILKKAKAGRPVKDPEQEYQDSLYKFRDGKRTGFPSVGFKGAMIRACRGLGMIMVDTRVQIHVVPDEYNGEYQLTEIFGDHEIHESFPRVANGNPDLRYRAIYPEWSALLTINYNDSVFSSEQIMNIVNWSGQCGIGEWRPEKNNTGAFGMYQVSAHPVIK